MEELNPEEYRAIEKFANDLRDSYEARLKDTKDSIISEAIKITLQCAIDILKLHLELAELQFKKYAYNVEKSFKEEKILDKS